jgi:hypothetical protein
MDKNPSKYHALSPQENSGLFLWRFSVGNREKTIADQEELPFDSDNRAHRGGGRLTRLNVAAKSNGPIQPHPLFFPSPSFSTNSAATFAGVSRRTRASCDPTNIQAEGKMSAVLVGVINARGCLCSAKLRAKPTTSSVSEVRQRQES